jgi:hypothetical protein
MSALAGWVLGGGLATLIVAITGLVAALKAHKKINAVTSPNVTVHNSQAPHQ